MEMLSHGKGKFPAYVEGKTVINGSYEDVMTVIAGLGDFQKHIIEGYEYDYGVRSYYDIITDESVESYSRGTLDRRTKECFSFMKLKPKPLTEDTTELNFSIGKRNQLEGARLRIIIVGLVFLISVTVLPMIFFTVTEWFTLGLLLGTLAYIAFWPFIIWFMRRVHGKDNSAEAQLKFFENNILKHINWELNVLQKAKEKMKAREGFRDI